MGKKHQLSHLVSDLSKSGGKAATATATTTAPVAAKHSAAPTAPKGDLPRTNFRKQEEFSSSSDDEGDDVKGGTNTTASSSAAQKGPYVAMPKKSSAAGNVNPNKNSLLADAVASPLGQKRAREDLSEQKKGTLASSKSTASAPRLIPVAEKKAVVETLTIGGKKKVVTQTGVSSDEDDDEDDDVSLDSFDADQMSGGSFGLSNDKGGNSASARKPAAATTAESDDDEDEDEDGLDEELEEGETEEADDWNDEDIEALLGMGGNSDEENGEDDDEEDDEDEDDSDFIDEEDDDAPSDADGENDDDYKNMAKELTKAKKDEGKKNANPNKKNDESVVVNFDAFGFEPEDVNQTIHLLDNFCPDRMNEVDRDELAEVLMAEPTSMLIKQGDLDSEDGSDDEDDSDHDDGMDDEEEDNTVMNNDADDVFAVYSLVPITNTLTTSDSDSVRVEPKTVANVAKSLGGVLANPWITMQRSPLTVGNLLIGAGNTLLNQKTNTPDTMLLVMDHIKTVPIDVTIAALDNIIADAEGDSSEEEARYTNKQLANVKIVCLAKIQRNAEKDNEKMNVNRGPGAPGGANNNKKRMAQVASAGSKVDKEELEAEKQSAIDMTPISFTGEGGMMTGAQKSKEERKKEKLAAAAENNGLILSDFVFWRPFEEALYDRRDTTVSVTAYKCRAQYDEQPDNDRPISVAFAVTWNGLKAAVTSVRNLAVPTVPMF